MAIACLVPAGVALVWFAFMLTFFWVRRPNPAAWWYDTLPATDIISCYLAAAVVAAPAVRSWGSLSGAGSGGRVRRWSPPCCWSPPQSRAAD